MAERLPRLGKRELFFLQCFTCNHVVSVRRGFLFLLVLGIGCVILLWHSLGLPHDYFGAHTRDVCTNDSPQDIVLQYKIDGSVFFGKNRVIRIAIVGIVCLFIVSP